MYQSGPSALASSSIQEVVINRIAKLAGWLLEEEDPEKAVTQGTQLGNTQVSAHLLPTSRSSDILISALAWELAEVQDLLRRTRSANPSENFPSSVCERRYIQLWTHRAHIYDSDIRSCPQLCPLEWQIDQPWRSDSIRTDATKPGAEALHP